jgi:phosphosulfolactate synthase
MVLDDGLPLRTLGDLIDSAGEFIDLVKFGWGTTLVSRELSSKVELLQENDIDFYFGGTLFEKHVLQRRFDEFRDLCREYACTRVEVSNGTVTMSNHQKADYIRKLATDFTVISEVGFKDPTRSEEFMTKRWIEYI